MAVDLEGLATNLARAGFRGHVATRAPLHPLTTYRLGGPAAIYFEPADEADLASMSAIAEQLGALEILLLGRGSNLVISDEGWPGAVIRLGPGFSAVQIAERPPAGRDPSAVHVRAGAAVSMPQLANWAARRNLAGVEFMVSIPGSVGGGVRMNAGAHGGQVSDHLVSIDLFELDGFAPSSRSAAELGLGYRHSDLRAREIVTAAYFSLPAGDPASIRARMDDNRRQRAETQPGALQNAGSVFKNPPGDHAGRLVEAAGLKGFRLGGAAVSALHANFFVADAGASAQDVHDLVHHVAREVHDRFGVTLQPEVRFVGSFTPPGER